MLKLFQQAAMVEPCLPIELRRQYLPLDVWQCMPEMPTLQRRRGAS